MCTKVHYRKASGVASAPCMIATVQYRVMIYATESINGSTCGQSIHLGP